MSELKLTRGSKLTLNADRLEAGLMKEGAQVTRRAKGFSDYSDFVNLVGAGYMELKLIGPKGGQRFVTTEKGKQALSSAKESVKQTEYA